MRTRELTRYTLEIQADLLQVCCRLAILIQKVVPSCSEDDFVIHVRDIHNEIHVIVEVILQFQNRVSEYNENSNHSKNPQKTLNPKFPVRSFTDLQNATNYVKCDIISRVPHMGRVIHRRPAYVPSHCTPCEKTQHTNPGCSEPTINLPFILICFKIRKR